MVKQWYTVEGFSTKYHDSQGRPRHVAWNEVYKSAQRSSENGTKYTNKDDALLAKPTDGMHWRVVQHTLTRTEM